MTKNWISILFKSFVIFDVAKVSHCFNVVYCSFYDYCVSLVCFFDYSYIHLVNKVTNISPSFISPIYVHTEKNYETYYHFFATLLKFEPSLSAISVIGTDGEQALVKAALHTFSENLIHLRCFIHMRDNIRRKLIELMIPGINLFGIYLECNMVQYTPRVS